MANIIAKKKRVGTEMEEKGVVNRWSNALEGLWDKEGANALHQVQGIGLCEKKKTTGHWP